MSKFKDIDADLFKSKVKAEWNRKPDVRAEFADDFDAYLAYREAVEVGATKP